METMLVAHVIPEVLQMSAFPTASTSTTADAEDPDYEQIDHEADWRKCPGCRHRRAHDDVEHNRIPGECRVPLIAPVAYDCPGCIRRKHRYNAALTYIERKSKIDPEKGTRGDFAGDSSIRELRFGMRNDLVQTVAGQPPGLGRLDSLGIEVQDNGTLKLVDPPWMCDNKFPGNKFASAKNALKLSS